MPRVYQPFMSPSPWSIPSRHGGPQNDFLDFEFWANRTLFPLATELMTLYGAWFEHAYWMSAGDKTEMTTEWIMWDVGGVAGGHKMMTSTAGNAAGYYVVKTIGRYAPSQVTAGRTTNTVDMSTKYDGMRGVWWGTWGDAYSSNQHNLIVAERPTVGTTDHGTIQVSLDRNYSSTWRVMTIDGNGNRTDNYVAGSPNCDDDTCAIQWEFVKGSHLTLKMYANVNGSYNFTGIGLPTWTDIETGTYVKKSLAASPLSLFVPVSFVNMTSSSADADVGSCGRLALEYRRIGNAWKYLV